MPWQFESDETSSGAMFSVYNEIGTRLTEPYIGERSARLIAAAPDLLAALKGVVSVADRNTIEFRAARAAIAKAS